MILKNIKMSKIDTEIMRFKDKGKCLQGLNDLKIKVYKHQLSSLSTSQGAKWQWDNILNIKGKELWKPIIYPLSIWCDKIFLRHRYSEVLKQKDILKTLFQKAFKSGDKYKYEINTKYKKNK